MTLQQLHSPRSFHATLDREAGKLTVPYGGQTRMRLTVLSGMADAHVRVDPEASDLIAIDCDDGLPPRLRTSESEVRVSWPWPETFGAWLRSVVGGHPSVELVLHPAVEWTLQVRGGLARFEANLASGHLAGLEISGGVSDARLDLPPPGDVVAIRISGGASHLTLRRPTNAGVALHVGGGIADLRLDDQNFDAIGGGAHLSSGPVHGDFPHYAVAISGGASGLYVVPRNIC